jgi:hypothetical protein
MKKFVKGGSLEVRSDMAKFTARKKPITITAYPISEEFEVETLEGTMKGKPGDWLMIGVNGEMYPCDKEIFAKTYDIISGYKDGVYFNKEAPDA